MSRRPDPGNLALRTLALVRLTNGLLGLLAPAVLSRRTSEDPDSTAPYYAFRMFGIRTVVLGADLLLLHGEPLRRARSEAVLIHACDAICAAVGGARGDLPRRAAVVTTVVSATNTVLALVARFAPGPPEDTTVHGHGRRPKDGHRRAQAARAAAGRRTTRPPGAGHRSRRRAG